MSDTKATAKLHSLGIDGRATSRLPQEHVTTLTLLAISVVMILLSRFISPSLGSWGQVQNILTLGSFLLVVSFGQGLVVLTGGLDLSIPNTFMLGGVLSTSLIGADNVGLWYFVPIILAVGAGAGIINGIGVSVFKIPPFIMTMGMGIIIYSVILGYTNGTTVGSSPTFLVTLMSARIMGIPLITIFLLLFSTLAWVIQSRSIFGRLLYAVGASPAAARIAGVPIHPTLITVYAVSGICGVIGGALLTGYTNGATLHMGDDYLLTSIAAVVVGGSSIMGGAGTVTGTFCGVLFLSTISSVTAATGMNEGWRMIISGGIILIAVLLQRGTPAKKFRWLRSVPGFLKQP